MSVFKKVAIVAVLASLLIGLSACGPRPGGHGKGGHYGHTQGH